MRTKLGTTAALILALSIVTFPALAQEEVSETLVSAKAVIYKNTAVIIVTNNPINVFDVKAIKIVNERGEIMKVRVGDGWSYKIGDDFVLVSAGKTLQSGQFVKIGVKTNSQSPIFKWYAYDESDDEIGSGLLRGKVIEREKTVAPPTIRPAPEPEKIEVFVDSTIYTPGQTIKVSGKGLKNTLAQACLYTSAKLLVFCKSGTADSNGTYRIDLDVPLLTSDGTYTIEASQGELRTSALVTIKVAPKTPTIPTTPTTGLTIRTDKAEYNGGDMVRISGIGIANNRVVVTVTSPAGDNYQLSDDADSSGNYDVLFFTRSSDRSGEWKVTSKQDRNSATAHTTFKLLTATSSSSSSTLTVRTDRDTYNGGDIVRIFGKATPNTRVTVTLESPDNIRHILTDNADTNGDYEVNFRTAPTDRAGTWNVNVEQNRNTVTITFQLRISTTTGSLTITLEKSTYDRGEMVKVTGIGLPNKKVTVVFEAPSGARVTFTDIADANGNYDVDFRTIQSDENGEWKVTATQESNSATARATFRLR